MGDQLAFEQVKGGMNAADPPHRIATNQVARMVNCQLLNQLPTTRPGVRFVPMRGAEKEWVSLENIQGAIFFNPAAGQGGIRLGPANSSIATAVGGRKFLAKISGRRHATEAEIVEITGRAATDRNLHLVYWCQWEDRLVANDGQSACFIWDGTEGRFSTGYDSIHKHASRIPNGGTCLGYAHTRGIVVSNSKAILASDSLHQTDLSTSANLENFIDQTYWATGQFFLPPTMLYGINAIANLPVRNTQHGHGETIFHCFNGWFSIDFNVFPRSAWSSSPMVKTAGGECGAVGPYAVAVYDGDQIFRTRKGVQSLRSAAANSLQEGQPEATVGAEVNTWLSIDYPRWHRFAVVERWSSAMRMFVTTQPIVHGRFRWNRGMLAKNMDPSVTEKGNNAVWEGLWTLPPEMAGIIHPVSGIFGDEERIFAWTRGADGRNRLVEIDETLNDDILEDGSRERIECQVITRMVDSGKWWMKKNFTTGRLYLRDIEGLVDWGIWFRTSENPRWQPWRAGKVNNPPDDENLLESLPRPIMIPLGDVPNACLPPGKSSESKGMQFLVRWKGKATLEGIKISHAEHDLYGDDCDPRLSDFVFGPIGETEYGDFDYSSPSSPWP